MIWNIPEGSLERATRIKLFPIVQLSMRYIVMVKLEFKPMPMIDCGDMGTYTGMNTISISERAL